MKIYILRHEDRTQDCTFFSPLTELGLQNSKKLADILKEHNINLIFSSPFIRTLQTVNPYLKNNNLTVNLEYGLCEIQHPDIIPLKSVGVTLPEYLAKHYNYNPKYTSYIKHDGLKYPENTKELQNRTIKIIKHIIKEYYMSNLNILLVTHQGICNTILKIINKSSSNYKNKLGLEILNGYQKGKLCLIFDNDWTFKNIN
jgi:2,3-bisphosphoglycerate-dependent phosphoglycerate mutase